MTIMKAENFLSVCLPNKKLDNFNNKVKEKKICKEWINKDMENYG